MNEITDKDDCVSKKPWSEVLNRSMKLFTFNAAREGGRSIGRAVFFVVVGLVFLGLATFVIDSLTGWFSSWFDFWPFNRGEVATEPIPQDRSWWPWASDRPSEITAKADEQVKWYCKFNPIC